MQVLHLHLKRTDYADSESRKKKNLEKLIPPVLFIHWIKRGLNEDQTKRMGNLFPLE